MRPRHYLCKHCFVVVCSVRHAYCASCVLPLFQCTDAHIEEHIIQLTHSSLITAWTELCNPFSTDHKNVHVTGHAHAQAHSVISIHAHKHC